MSKNTTKPKRTRNANKRDTAKHVVRQYLEDLYNSSHGQLLQIPKRDLDNCKNFDRLIDHTYTLLESQEKIYNPEKYNKDNYPNRVFISRNTIRDAIRELRDDYIIYFDKDNRCFRYSPSEHQIYNQFPILKIAPDITITPLPCSAVVYFHVSPTYADAVVNYINAQCKPDDIRAVNLGGIIMCMEFKTYSAQLKHVDSHGQNNISESALFTRICKILKKFNLTSLTHTSITNPDIFFKTKFESAMDELMAQQLSQSEDADE